MLCPSQTSGFNVPNYVRCIDLDTQIELYPRFHEDFNTVVVYATPVNDAEELLQRVENACQLIRDDNMVLERTRHSCARHAQACINNGEGHIEHLL
ncbi:hypothetical protein ANN_05993 [Periplaneta americana]|uniref:Uncharacterized protein n=1 Tax=Periplaneta americana TaxID=6978 RepID=A0ABQ8TD91_PERAM|nr:hypothetical protein ANN_05993 [Periplaneta americana]